MPFLDEIVGRLIEQGVGTLASNIFKGSNAVIPASGGPFLSIAETGGTSSAKTQNDTATERPTAQLRVRADDYKDARAMLTGAYAALGGANGLYNVTLSGVFYLSITARQGPTDMGKEEGTGRAQLVFNIDAEKQPS